MEKLSDDEKGLVLKILKDLIPIPNMTGYLFLTSLLEISRSAEFLVIHFKAESDGKLGAG